ncbi:hypothetical protein LTR85_010238 [Meristemomyces frigidus]|nr:hypothetical protein LTR85_010238 [Meristemomyces frigidus]
MSKGTQSLKNATLRFSSLPSNPSFERFVHHTISLVPENQSLIVTADKTVVDDAYKGLLKQRFVHDDRSVRKFMEEARSIRMKDFWEATKAKYAGLAGSTDVAVEKMDLPAICGNHRGDAREKWELQTYADFATKAEKRNAHVQFDQALMNDAFRTQVSRLLTVGKGKRPSAHSPGKPEKMMKRASIARNLNVKVPRIHPHQASYPTFLSDFASLNITQWRSAQLHKGEVNDWYAQGLRQTFPRDSLAVRSLLDKASSASGHIAWDASMSANAPKARPAQVILSNEVLQLNLPELSRHPSRAKNGKDRFDSQSYREFADAARKENGQVGFTKERMDDAFRHAASRTPKKPWAKKDKLSFDRMVLRCPGRESEEYWKGK